MSKDDGSLKKRLSREAWLETELDRLWVSRVVGKCEDIALLPLVDYRLKKEADGFRASKMDFIADLIDECLAIDREILFADPTRAAKNLHDFLRMPKNDKAHLEQWRVANFAIARVAAMTGAERTIIEHSLDVDEGLETILERRVANYRPRKITKDEALFLNRRLLEPRKADCLVERIDIWASSMPEIRCAEFDQWRAMAHYHETRRMEEKDWPVLLASRHKNVRLLVLDIASRKTALKKKGAAVKL